MSDLSRESTGPWRDPIVAEVRAAREALLAEADYDLHTLCERLRHRQLVEGRTEVSRAPRPPATAPGRPA